MGKDCKSSSSGCVINTLNLYNFIVKATWQCISDEIRSKGFTLGKARLDFRHRLAAMFMSSMQIEVQLGIID